MFVININDKSKQEIKYPCLVRGRLCGQVVLFLTEKDAVTIERGRGAAHVGHVENSWVGASDSGAWEVLVDDLEIIIQRKGSE